MQIQKILILFFQEENSRKIVLSNKELMQAVEERTRALNKVSYLSFVFPSRLLCSYSLSCSIILFSLILIKEREVTAEVMSKSPDAVMALDKNFTFSEFNPVMERVTGKSKSEVLGKHYLEVFPGLQVPFPSAFPSSHPSSSSLFCIITFVLI